MTTLALVAIAIGIAALSTFLVRVQRRRSTKRKVERVMREPPYTPSISLRQSRMYATRDEHGDVDLGAPGSVVHIPRGAEAPVWLPEAPPRRPEPDEGSALIDLGTTLAIGATLDAVFSPSSSSDDSGPSLSVPDSASPGDFSGDGGGEFGGQPRAYGRPGGIAVFPTWGDEELDALSGRLGP